MFDTVFNLARRVPEGPIGPYRTDRLLQKGQLALLEQDSCPKRAKIPRVPALYTRYPIVTRRAWPTGWNATCVQEGPKEKTHVTYKSKYVSNLALLKHRIAGHIVVCKIPLLA